PPSAQPSRWGQASQVVGGERQTEPGAVGRPDVALPRRERAGGEAAPEPLVEHVVLDGVAVGDGRAEVEARRHDHGARRRVERAGAVERPGQARDPPALAHPRPRAATSNWTTSTAPAVISSRKRSSPYSVSLPQTGIGLAAWTRAWPATS